MFMAVLRVRHRTVSDYHGDGVSMFPAKTPGPLPGELTCPLFYLSAGWLPVRRLLQDKWRFTHELRSHGGLGPSSLCCRSIAMRSWYVICGLLEESSAVPVCSSGVPGRDAASPG